MANFKIKIDLLKLSGAFIQNLKGKTTTKRCVIIPVDDNDGIYVGEKGCYLNAVAFELREPRYTDTHFIKADLTKERRESMTEDERNAVPILGGLHAIEAQRAQEPAAAPNTGVATAAVPQTGEQVDDLPF